MPRGRENIPSIEKSFTGCTPGEHALWEGHFGKCWSALVPQLLVSELYSNSRFAPQLSLFTPTPQWDMYLHVVLRSRSQNLGWACKDMNPVVTGVFVSCCCCNKSLQTQWLKTTQILLFSSVQEVSVRELKSKCWQICIPLEARGTIIALPFLTRLWHWLFCPCQPPSAC